LPYIFLLGFSYLKLFILKHEKRLKMPKTAKSGIIIFSTFK